VCDGGTPVRGDSDPKRRSYLRARGPTDSTKWQQRPRLAPSTRDIARHGAAGQGRPATNPDDTAGILVASGRSPVPTRSNRFKIASHVYYRERPGTTRQPPAVIGGVCAAQCHYPAPYGAIPKHLRKPSQARILPWNLPGAPGRLGASHVLQRVGRLPRSTSQRRARGGVIAATSARVA
jgi:hypothetical protein